MKKLSVFFYYFALRGTYSLPVEFQRLKKLYDEEEKVVNSYCKFEREISQTRKENTVERRIDILSFVCKFILQCNAYFRYLREKLSG